MAAQNGEIEFGGVHGYLARAEHGSAGVLLLPLIFGLNPFVRSYAESLAAVGLTALVWDPYEGEPPIAKVQEALPRSMRVKDEPALVQMSKCVDYMLGELRLSAVGTAGFCMGGRFTMLLCARDKRLKACVPIYPSLEAPRLANQDEDAVARSAEIECPVHLVYPGRDHVTEPATFFCLQERLQRRGAATVVHYDPVASHGFMHASGEINQAATALARPQIAAFLTACLG